MKLVEIEKSLVFEQDKFFSQCHASTILKVEDRLLCAFFAGTKEGDDDVRIYLCVNENGKWSDPEQMSFTKDIPCWNPVLLEKDGTIFLFFKAGKEITKWQTFLRTSTDGGRTWTEATELVPGDETGGRGPVKNKAIVLSDGTVVAPASVETETEWDSFIDISRDGCKTWQKGEIIFFDHKKAVGKGIIQPTLWEADGKVYALLRSTEGYVMRSFSEDLVHWAPAEKADLPNNNSGIDCVKLPDSSVAVFHNPIACADWGDRNIISYAVTKDNGETFLPAVEVEKDEDTDAEFSYPAAITDGEYVYLTYTHYRKNVMFRKFRIETDL
ncbi:MAG: exo-alpha-sialidase [Clostridia bacterium]|nr:exo-alpha-sialidase [Clostridia bacterium]